MTQVITKEQLLAKTGEFQLTFTKADGTPRTGTFSIATEQRNTSNTNLVTLVENGEFRAVDVTRITHA